VNHKHGQLKKDRAYDLNDFAGGSIEMHELLFRQRYLKSNAGKWHSLPVPPDFLS
jgi:hypothetical protein